MNKSYFCGIKTFTEQSVFWKGLLPSKNMWAVVRIAVLESYLLKLTSFGQIFNKFDQNKTVRLKRAVLDHELLLKQKVMKFKLMTKRLQKKIC